MGANTSQLTSEQASLVSQFENETYFTKEELLAIARHYATIAGSLDAPLDEFSFFVTIGLRNSLYSQRLYQKVLELSHHQDTRMISFSDFLHGMSVFASKAPIEEKIIYSFSLFDTDGDGFISSDELEQMMKAAAVEFKSRLSDEQIRAMCEATIARYSISDDREGLLSLRGYCAAVADSPFLIQRMSPAIPTGPGE